MGSPVRTRRTSRSTTSLPKESPRQRHDRMVRAIDAVLADIDSALERCTLDSTA
jgi:hypothetical protein